VSCKRRRKFILYGGLWPGYKIIDLSDELRPHVEIVVTLANKKTSVVRIGSAIDESEMLNAIVLGSGSTAFCCRIHADAKLSFAE
jgi:hypothetical protein